MIKKILVATDDSEPAKRAVKYALDLAGTLHAELTAVNVVDLPSVTERQAIAGEVSPTHLIEPFEDYMNQVGADIMARIESSCRERGIPFRGLVKTGHPVEQIAAAAQKTGADLVILGSRGRGALGSVLLGSVTLGIIHKDIRVPVLIVK